MNIIGRRLHDRLGNQLFQYVNARAYAEKHDCELHTTPWLGERIFTLDSKPLAEDLPKRADMDADQWNGETNIELTGWCLNQRSLIYSRADVRRWLPFKPEILEAMELAPRFPIAAHLRHGDLVGHDGFVAISKASYVRAATQAHLEPNEIQWVSEEAPLHISFLHDLGIGFMADFAALMYARVLFRANSSFSFWAAVLGLNDAVFSPDLTGIPTGQPTLQEVPFVRGNHCAISKAKAHYNCSDLHLREI